MLDIPADHVIIISSFLFIIGFFGIAFNRKNIISVLLSLELMLLASSLNFIAGSLMNNDVHGQVFSFFILAVSAAEFGIGLALIVCIFKKSHYIDLEVLK